MIFTLMKSIIFYVSEKRPFPKTVFVRGGTRDFHAFSEFLTKLGPKKQEKGSTEDRDPIKLEFFKFGASLEQVWRPEKKREGLL